MKIKADFWFLVWLISLVAMLVLHCRREASHQYPERMDCQICFKPRDTK